MEKTYFTLCGADAKIQSWVQPVQELTGLLNLTQYTDLISANPHPLRYWHQIPSRWLEQDPGFKILLRDFAPSEVTLPLWVLRPDQYLFESFHSGCSSKVLIIVHHADSFESWSEIQNRFPDKNLVWSCYNVGKFPDWPKALYINMNDALFSEQAHAEAFFDLNYWHKDTLSPLHLHLLQVGSRCLNPVNLPQVTETLYKAYYGRLALF